MELDGCELELVSSCHRLRFKSMVLMSSVPYKYIANDKQSFIQGQETIPFILCSLKL